MAQAPLPPSRVHMSSDDVMSARIHASPRPRARLQRYAVAFQGPTLEPLRETIADLERFNAMVSHDLLGPLVGITHLAELALRALDDGRTERAAESLAMIGRQSRMSSQLLRSLLLLSRAAKAGPRRELVQLSSVVARAVEQVKLEHPEAVRVQWVLNELPTMSVDPILVQQVFVNLVGNAVKFSAGVASPRIEIGTHPVGNATAIFVRDNGIGFEPMTARVSKPVVGVGGGAFDKAGIGLSIVQRIVEVHGGRIWCESRPGCGATVRFTLDEAVS